MKLLLSIFFSSFFLLNSFIGNTQNQRIIDSLHAELKKRNPDTKKVEILQNIANAYDYSNKDSSLMYYEKAYFIAKKTKNGNLIADVLTDIGITYNNTGENNLAIKKFDEAVAYIENENVKSEENKLRLARIYNSSGEAYRYLSNYENAMAFYNKGINVCNIIDTTNHVNFKKANEIKASCFNNIGMVNLSQGDYNDAIINYQKALKIHTKSKNLKSVATCYTNMGNVHFYQGDYEKAITYYSDALKTFEKINHKKGMSACLTNIGSVQLLIGKKTEDNKIKLKKFNLAISYYERAVTVFKDINDKNSTADCYGNIGLTYSEIAFFSNNSIDIYNKAIEYYHKTLDLKKEIKDELGTAICYINISSLNNKRKNFDEAISNANKSLLIVNKIGAKQQRKAVYENLATAYEGLNNLAKAIEYFKLSTLVKDSLFNEKKSEQLAEMEERFQSEKKQLEIDKLTNEKALQESEIKKQKILSYSFVIGFLLISVFSILLFKQFQAKKRANKILAQQKLEIEEKNEELNQQNEEITAQRDEIEAQRDEVVKHKEHIEEIHHELTDSIIYAKRIQEALLPTEEIFDEYFLEHFIIFKPHSVVSGDFYWSTKVKEYVIFSVADCTGHGVPGAFMSMLGISFLNEIVRHTHIVTAGDVLNELRRKVIHSLKQKGELEKDNIASSLNVKDGMDISLCVLNTETNELQFAGANNPLYIVKSEKLRVKSDELQDKSLSSYKVDEKSNSDFMNFTNFQLYELKPDKMPIAIYLRMDDFTNHTITVEKGDMLYLFSDGYIDQAGGKLGKRFMSKRLKQLFLDNAHLSMNEQKNVILENFENWKGDNDQVDDITILGVKLS
ncbi:MAG: hypothetical protein A2W98_05350 [Bacteroidetes bacterium GWF2_33_38]|nr:MAG: hypothetical protein A2W98_05350 [Bacteroidetes bacterium GWF2_33_38]